MGESHLSLPITHLSLLISHLSSLISHLFTLYSLPFTLYSLLISISAPLSQFFSVFVLPLSASLSKRLLHLFLRRMMLDGIENRNGSQNRQT